jgi:hypothetical protein
MGKSKLIYHAIMASMTGIDTQYQRKTQTKDILIVQYLKKSVKQKSPISIGLNYYHCILLGHFST